MIPMYAILSHTWNDSEITFRDMEGDNVEKRVEYKKIRKTCDMAAAHGFDYVWIDTCCIDKTSSAELSEAINSMYRWYQDCGVCYVYLADVPPKIIDHRTGVIGHDVSKSRWFTRGWTLQELIAPSTVIILDQNWQEIGTKASLQGEISYITSIPIEILLGGDLEGASLAQRMSWASKRNTTRVEDLAYCLMGIFGINMPLLYGEGERAFTRLQEEIMKVSDDYSLFAWRSSEKHGGLLATSPAAFINSGHIIPSNRSKTLSGAITVNNKGIYLKLRLAPNFQDRPAILPCTENGQEVAIYLRAMSETEEYFVRTRANGLKLLDPKDLSLSQYQERNICVRQERRMRKNQSSLQWAAANGQEAIVKLLLEKGANPEAEEDYNGQTPLLRAAANGHEEVVKLLLQKGANLESKDNNGRTSLFWAAANRQDIVVRLLLEKGANHEAKDNGGRTPLIGAAAEGHEGAVKLLLEKGTELETKDQIGQTSLLWAAGNGHEAVVKILLEKGAELEAKDDYFGRTPLSRAAANGHEAIVKLLLEKGANLEAKDDYNGHTPLLRAAASGHGEVVKLLLEKGASLKAKDELGQTLLLLAAGNGTRQ